MLSHNPDYITIPLVAQSQWDALYYGQGLIFFSYPALSDTLINSFVSRLVDTLNLGFTICYIIGSHLALILIIKSPQDKPYVFMGFVTDYFLHFLFYLSVVFVAVVIIFIKFIPVVIV